ncbi:CLUMA_CG004271, isoform A [Clunio marinus]|uniref:CLUMA_CG004271, isoform A n=1 Tax=Clunio marinus TaxID=568069 RepID=A0A1J1HR66_9DIPT|nr:CLUMA_CG004271, isoform A [Clunio marinus]
MVYAVKDTSSLNQEFMASLLKLCCSFKKKEVNHFSGCQADFDSQLESAGELLVLVDFHATWCGPCKMIAPKLEEFANAYADKIVIVKVDVDDCEELAMRYNISSMPTFVFIKKGQQIDSFSGANAEKLEKYIIQHSS